MQNTIFGAADPTTKIAPYLRTDIIADNPPANWLVQLRAQIQAAASLSDLKNILVTLLNQITT